jgi:hypothetical protein
MPNPVNDVLQLQFKLESAATTRVYLFDQQGVLVKVLRANRQLPAGIHTEQFNLPQLPAGTYTCVLETSAWKASKTVLIVH